MFCPSCEAELPAGAIACYKCHARWGEKLSPDSVAVPVHRENLQQRIIRFSLAKYSAAKSAWHESSRYFTMAIVALLFIGVFCAISLPSLTFQQSGLLGSTGGNLSFLALLLVFSLHGGTWPAIIAVAGVLVAMAAAFGIWEDTMLSPWLVSIGALAALAVPIRAYVLLQEAITQASHDGTRTSGNLGTGLILASIAFVVAAVLPWAWKYVARWKYLASVID